MSDQDFFFDEDEIVEEAPAKGAKKAPAKAASSKPAPKPTKVAASGSSQGVAFIDQALPMQVVLLIAVIALLVGVILGFFIAPRSSGTTAVTTPAVSGGMGGGMGTTGGTAPQLSDEQIQQGMPAGHPPVGGASTEPTATE